MTETSRSGPPDDTDLWTRLTAMPRPSKVVDFPRKDPSGAPVGQVAIWVLTQEEQSAAAAAAQNITQKIVKEVPKKEDAQRGYDDVYDNVAAAEVLWRACRKPGNLLVPAFPSPTELRARLTVDEVGALLNHYYAVMADLGPVTAGMGSEEMDALVERIAKSGERFPLDLLSPGLLRTLAFSLACRLYTLQRDKSSAGSQPEAAIFEPLSGDAVPEV